MPFLFPEAAAEILVALVVTLAVEGYLGGIGGVWQRYPRIGTLAQRMADRLALRLDRDLLSPASQRFRGWIALLTLVLPAMVTGAALQVMASDDLVIWAILVLVMAGTVGQRSAYAAAEPVFDHSAAGDMANGRRAVDTLTDQDVHGLDQAGVLRAAIEGTVTAHIRDVSLPVLAAVLAGLPGLFAVTVISAVGRTLPRVTSPEFAAPARMLARALLRIASPLSALFFAIAAIGGPGTNPFDAVREGGGHRADKSPGAMAMATVAGALGVKLGGPKIYAQKVVARPWLNAAASPPSVHDLRRFLTLYALAAIVSLALLAVLLLVTLTRLP